MAKSKNKTSSSPASVAPTGLSIARKGNAIIFSWNIGDTDYGDGQEMFWGVNGVTLWGPAAIGGGITSQIVAVDFINNTINTVGFGVRGNRKKYKPKKKHEVNPGWSQWSTFVQSFYMPAVPILSYSIDRDNTNAGTFTWGINNVDELNIFPFTRWEFQSIIVKDWASATPPEERYWCNAGSADGVLEHATGTTASYSWYRKEDTSLFSDPNYSYTRWVRVRSVGSAGTTAWSHARHVYSQPRQTTDVKATAIPRAGNSGYSISVEWNAPESVAYPIEQDIINYSVIKPKTTATAQGDTMVTTIEYPTESQSWTQVSTINDTSGKDSSVISISETLADDECIFVRIDTKYDSHTITGIPTLVENGMGRLAKPSVNSITSNPSTHRVTVNAANNSELAASFLAIYFRTDDNPGVYKTIGVMKKTESEITVQCPDWGDKQFSIGVQAVLGDYSPIERKSSGVTEYTIPEPHMQSEIVWDEGRVPMPPTLALSSPNSTTIKAVWDWPWTEANQTELSWADHEDAWESTNEPQTYIVKDLYAGSWNIAGVSTGTWYVRARLIKATEDKTVYGLYSETQMIKLSSAPAIPSLILSSGVVSEEGEVTCFWAYTSTDGTQQMHADICEATYDSENQKYTYGKPFISTQTAQHVSFLVKDRGWKAGETHYLAVRVISASGEQSQGWSTPVALRIADPLTLEITNTSLVSKAITTDDVTRNPDSLTDLPLSVTLNSNGACNKITIMLERAKDFHMRRPDETKFDGYQGEIVASKTVDGDGTYTITAGDLIGHLDDGASYNIVAIGKDQYGQSAEDIKDFEVHWDHQAVIPSAECSIDTEYNVAILKPVLPAGYTKQEGDVCDIYRLSIDGPELIYENAEFDQRYVDLYPTLGDTGGHRFVFKTKNGDYTTADNHIAWYDTDADENDLLDIFSVLIDFNGEQISLPYNVGLSSRWSKDFQQTTYLGGSIVGDWNPGVNRTGSITTVGIVDEDEVEDTTIESVRRLANYPGICHVRTPDGSSYAANINVSEDREEKMIRKLAKYSLEVTKIDSESLDGVTYELWQHMINEEE